MLKTLVVLAAAGRSSRFLQSASGHLGKKRATDSKVFVELMGKPLWQHCIDRFRAVNGVGRIYMALSVDVLSKFRAEYSEYLDQFDVKLVPGGIERWASVQNAIQQIVDDHEAEASLAHDLIAIHDAARPCISVQAIERVLQEAGNCGGAILAQRLWGTIKRTDRNGLICETVSRENLFQASTPQVFRSEWLQQVYSPAFIDHALAAGQLTDDAQLIALAGHKVRICEDAPSNIKVTTQADLQLAESFLKETC